MKVLFTVPITSYISEMPPILQDLGLGYLANAVRKEGHDVIIRDWNMPPSEDDYIEYIRREKPQAVGIKVFSKDVGAASRTVKTIKSVDSSIHIIVGGPHPSATPSREVFDNLNGIDFIFRGEAEVGLPLLLQALSDSGGKEVKGSFDHVPGLVWMSNGSIVENDINFSDVEKYELPSWDLLKPENYPSLKGLNKLKSGNSAPFITSRGCPGLCSFCSVNTINGRKIRRRPIKSVIEELSFLYHEHNVRFLMFTDNGFLVDENYVQELCDSIITQGLKFQWDCVLIETGRVIDEKTLRLMKKAGCIMVGMGIESASERIRGIINKNNTIDMVVETINRLRRNDINIFGFFMMGFPTETRMEIEETIRFARSHGFHMVSFTICYPIPGTEVYRYLLDKYNIEKIDWTSFDIHRSPYPLSELESESLSKLYRKTNMEFMITKDFKGLLKKTINFIKKKTFVMK